MSFKNKLTRVVFFSYFPIVLVFAVVRMLGLFGLLHISNTWGYVINSALQILIIFLIPVAGFCIGNKMKPKESLKFFGYKKTSKKAIFISILIGFIVYILTVFISSFWSALIGTSGASSGGESQPIPFYVFLINLVVTAILPAICEETAHRGLLTKGLSVMGTKKAIILSSILFGLVHLNVNQVLYATLIGFILSYVALLCDSIYPAMIVHFTNNALSVIMSYSYTNKLGLDFFFTWINSCLQTNPIIAILFVITLMICLVMALRYLIKVLFHHTAMKNLSQLQKQMFIDYTRNGFFSDIPDIWQSIQDSQKVADAEQESLYQQAKLTLGQATDLEVFIATNDEKYKIDKVSLILLSCILFLGVTITFLTWLQIVWGIF